MKQLKNQLRTGFVFRSEVGEEESRKKRNIKARQLFFFFLSHFAHALRARRVLVFSFFSFFPFSPLTSKASRLVT